MSPLHSFSSSSDFLEEPEVNLPVHGGNDASDPDVTTKRHEGGCTCAACRQIPRRQKNKKRKADSDAAYGHGGGSGGGGSGGGSGSRAKKGKPTVADFEELLVPVVPQDPYAKQVVLGGGKKTVYTELQPGMLLYHPARLMVKSREVKNGIPHLEVENLDVHGPTRQYVYQGDALISSQCFNCDQYAEVKQETMSSLARILKEQVGDMLCKVEFTKEPVPSEMATMLARGSEMIEELFTEPGEKARQYKRLYERTQKGEYRIMRGYILRDMDMSTQESETGMIKFLDADLMAQKKFAQRQVNLRHLHALVLNGVRYERK